MELLILRTAGGWVVKVNGHVSENFLAGSGLGLSLASQTIFCSAYKSFLEIPQWLSTNASYTISKP